MANIVLAHGILGFDTIAVGGFTLANYFNDVKAELEKLNHHVYVPRVSPIGKVDLRADEFHEEVAAHFNARGEPKELIILAHSMGGLDAKVALTKYPELREITKALVSIGSPHAGSPIADSIQDLLGPGFALVRNWLGGSVGALNDLTQAYCLEIDAKASGLSSDVSCYSIAGTNQQEHASFFFKKLGGFINEASDGVVPHSSAVKNNHGWTNLPDWPVDHAGLIGWFDLGTKEQVHAEHLARYVNLVELVS